MNDRPFEGEEPIVHLMGGAGGGYGFAHRDARIMANVAALYERPDEAPVHEAWVRRLGGALEQGNPGVYVGFLGDEGEARVRAAYPASHWDRLVEVKRRYDPSNLFRLNQNVPPEA